MASLTQRTVRNIGLVAALQFTAAAINTLALVILARLLTPYDFGLVGVAGVILNLIGQFSDFGLGAAVVQRREEVERAVRVAATIRLGLACLLVFVTFVLAPFFASLMYAPAATDIIRVSSVLWLIAGAGFVSSTLLWRELAFRKLTAIGVVGSLAGAAVSIVMAFQGFAYWSIVVGNLVVAMVSLGMLWALRPWRFQLLYHRGIARELLGYGKHIFVIGFLAFVMQNADNAAVATVLGVATLGFYYIAYKWATVVTGFVVRTVGRVLFPTYASIQTDRDRVTRGLLNTVRALALPVFPAQIGILLVAPEFVPVVLGPGWEAAVVPLQVLSVLGLVTVLVQPIGDFFLATGRASLVSRANLLNAAILVPSVFAAAVVYGVLGVAIVVVGSYAAYAGLMLYFLQHSYSIRISDVARTWRHPLLGSAAMAGAVLVAKLLLPGGAWLLVAEVLVGAAVYAVVVMRLDGAYVKGLLAQIRRPGSPSGCPAPERPPP